MDRKRVEIFETFEEENEAEYRRRAEMTPEERMQEFAELRARQWGEDWGQEADQESCVVGVGGLVSPW